jgi:hypothetical protein
VGWVGEKDSERTLTLRYFLFQEDYKGKENDYDEGIRFFLDQFLKRNMQVL